MHHHARNGHLNIFQLLRTILIVSIWLDQAWLGKVNGYNFSALLQAIESLKATSPLPEVRSKSILGSWALTLFARAFRQ